LTSATSKTSQTTQTGPLNEQDLQAQWQGRRVLITGGLGFIGSSLARRLVDLGSDILIVDSMIPQYGGNWFNLSGIEDRVKVNLSDLRDRHVLPHLVRGREVIFNLVGQTSHLDSMTDPLTDLAGSSLPARDRSTAHLLTCRSMRSIRWCPLTSTASTSWPESSITCSITACTDSKPAACG
jgi:UDP-glucose 4-epimerase